MKVKKIKQFKRIYVVDRCEDGYYIRIAFKIVLRLYKDKLFLHNKISCKIISNYFGLTPHLINKILMYTFGLKFKDLLTVIRALESFSITCKTEVVGLTEVDIAHFCNITKVKSDNILEAISSETLKSRLLGGSNPIFSKNMDLISSDIKELRKKQYKAAGAFIKKYDY